MDRATKQAATSYYQENPRAFFEEILGVTLEDYQLHALMAVWENERVCIKSCHDLGKSFILARIMLAMAACYQNTKVITTAPTWRQVERILWSEARAAYQKARMPLGGKMLTTAWNISPEWFCVGFSPKNEASTGGEGQGTQSSFQGFHVAEDGYLVIIFDEATGIPKQIWTMAEGLLTSGRVKFIAVGNPTSMQSEFYRCFTDRAWYKIAWSCFNSPNLRANGITEMQFLEWEIEKCKALSDVDFAARMKSYKEPKPWLLTLKWVIPQAIKWGLTHPLTVSKILGEFPQESDNVKMPLAVVEAAQRREVSVRASDRRSLGIDVARYGSDSTVFTYLHGPRFIAKKVLAKKDTTEVVGEALEFARTHGMPDIFVIDETGLGGGVVDLLRENQRGRENDRINQAVEIRGVQFGGHPAPEKANDRERGELGERYTNMKARMYDLLAEDLKANLQLPDEAVYTEELPTVLYAYDSKGRLKIESKDDYKKRTGRGSPDHADSLALANFGRHDALQTGNFTKELIPDKIKSIASSFRSGVDSW